MKKQDTNKALLPNMLEEGQQCPPVKEMCDLLTAGLVKISHESGNRLIPFVTLDDKYFQDLCSPLNKSVVIKLLGKNVGYNMMKKRLKKLWKLTRGFDIMDIDDGYYMLKSNLLADKKKIVLDGLWMLFDHYLVYNGHQSLFHLVLRFNVPWFGSNFRV